MHNDTYSNPVRARGFTLFEVLIAVLVLSIGLLGIAGLQVASLNNTNNAYLKSLGTMLANDMADRIRSNPTAVAAGAYNNITAKPSSVPAGGCTSSACNSGDMATVDIANWFDLMSNNLPGGTGTITGNGTTFTVNVMWEDADGTGCPAAAGSLYCLSTTFTP